MISKKKVIVGLVFVGVFVVAILGAVSFMVPTEAARKETQVGVVKENVADEEMISQQVAGKSNEMKAVDVKEAENTELADLENLMNNFASAYFAGDKEQIKSYLSDSFEGEIDTYYADAAAVHISEIKGLSAVTASDMDTDYVVSVEYKENEDADYYCYLTVSLVKEVDDWKVKWYAIEG